LIDETRDSKAVEQIVYEAGAADHGSGGDGGAGVGKANWKIQNVRMLRRSFRRLRGDVLEEKPVIPDKAVSV